MVLEEAIIIGLSVIAGLSAYFSFQFRESETTFGQVSSVVFFNLSLLFVNFIVYTILLIVQNTAELAYLDGAIMGIMLNIIIWVTIITFFAYFLLTLLNGIIAMFTQLKAKFKP